MKSKLLFRATSGKSPREFIQAMRENAPQFSFQVHEVVEMRELYQGYGVEVADDFAVFTLTLCNPQKSYKSITKNPERQALIIEQKQIVVYNDNGTTTINYLPVSAEFVSDVFPDDEPFPESIVASQQKRIAIIEASL